MGKMNENCVRDMNGRKLKVGDKVFWHDPEDEIASACYEIYKIEDEEYIAMSNPYSECEAYACELEKISEKRYKDEMKKLNEYEESED